MLVNERSDHVEAVCYNSVWRMKLTQVITEVMSVNDAVFRLTGCILGYLTNVTQKAKGNEQQRDLCHVCSVCDTWETWTQTDIQTEYFWHSVAIAITRIEVKVSTKKITDPEFNENILLLLLDQQQHSLSTATCAHYTGGTPASLRTASLTVNLKISSKLYMQLKIQVI